MSRFVTTTFPAPVLVFLVFITGSIASAQDMPRILLGLAVIEAEAPALSFETVAERADAAFAVLDSDESLTLDTTELRAWRDGFTPGADEAALTVVAEIDPSDILALLDANGDKTVTPSEARALALYDAALLDVDVDGTINIEERSAEHPSGLAVWAARPCLEFGIGEGMLLGAFCGK